MGSLIAFPDSYHLRTLFTSSSIMKVDFVAIPEEDNCPLAISTHDPKHIIRKLAVACHFGFQPYVWPFVPIQTPDGLLNLLPCRVWQRFRAVAEPYGLQWSRLLRIVGTREFNNFHRGMTRFCRRTKRVFIARRGVFGAMGQN